MPSGIVRERVRDVANVVHLCVASIYGQIIAIVLLGAASEIKVIYRVRVNRDLVSLRLVERHSMRKFAGKE